MHSYNHHIGDFDKDTRHLTRIERSIYSDLIDLYYITEKPLSLDIKWLSKRVLAFSEDERTAVEQVLNEFFNETEQGWFHSRCDSEILKYRRSTSQKAIAGRASAAAKEARRQQMMNERSTAVEQTYNGISTNQETNNQETNNHPNTSQCELLDSDIQDSLTIGLEGKKQCPHKEIIGLYHEILPASPRVKEWTPKRAKQLNARWNEKKDRQNLDYWKNLFEYIADNDFLCGRKTGFVATLEWITNLQNFTKIREGFYEPRD